MTPANTPDLRALMERLENCANRPRDYYASTDLCRQAAAALTTLQHRIAEMEGLLSRAMDRMEYGQRWRCGQVGPTPDYAEIIAEIEGSSTLKDRGEGR